MKGGFDLTLSFDNGPTGATTPFVLDVLARHGLRATFFVVGRRLAEPGGRALAARAHDEGHWIGNHTWSHDVPLGAQRDAAVAAGEILRTQELMGDLAHPLKLFRPFGGGGNLDQRLLNAAARDLLLAGGYTCVLWNAIPRDWCDPQGWVERALAQCRAQPWTLMVLHDLPTGAMQYLDHFLQAAAAQGARFRQDFPPQTLPIVAGRAVRSLTDYVAA